MSVFPLCSVKTTQKSSLLLSRPLSETNFSLKLAAQHNITSALQGESAAPKTLRNMQVMNFLSFNSLFSCKGRSFVFSPSPENEKKKRIKGWFSAFLFFFFLPNSPQKQNIHLSLLEAKKRPRFYLRESSFELWRTYFLFASVVGGMSGHLLSRRSSCWLHPKPDEIGQGEPSPHLTLRRTLLSRRKPILSARCSCSLPPCWSREMDPSRWPQPAQCLLGPPTHPHAIAPRSHSVLTAHALLFPPRRRTSEPPSAASRMWDSPPRSPDSRVFLGWVYDREIWECLLFFFFFF